MFLGITLPLGSTSNALPKAGSQILVPFSLLHLRQANTLLVLASGPLNFRLCFRRRGMMWSIVASVGKRGDSPLGLVIWHRQ